MSLSQYENELIDKMLSGDRVALSRLITLAESRHGSLPAVLKRLDSLSERSYIIGVTGPPGAGKSTLTNRLIAHYRYLGKTVGVLAVDPSSPFSGGAILGDRIRMHDHSMDDGVFIRSISTRGTHGGISRASREIIKLFSAFGLDYVIVETVGVGQSELDVIRIADTVLVVLVPEAGDGVQTMKAGLMEIADIFVVNKCDREGANLITAEIRQIVSLKSPGKEWKQPVLMTSAAKGEGIDKLADEVENHREFQEKTGRLRLKRETRREEEFSEIVKEAVEAAVSEKLTGKEVKKIYDRVKKGELDPYEGAKLVLSKII